MLIESDPQLFHITEHYRDWPMMLVRLDRATPELVRGFLERRFRAIATKKLRAEWEAGVDEREALFRALAPSSPTFRHQSKF